MRFSPTRAEDWEFKIQELENALQEKEKEMERERETHLLKVSNISLLIMIQSRDVIYQLGSNQTCPDLI